MPQDKSVNPRDVLFTLGRSGRCAANACITDERLMTHAGAPLGCKHKQSEPTSNECGCAVRGAKPPPAQDAAKDCERNMLRKLLVELDVDKERVPTPPSAHARSRECQCARYDSSTDSSSCDSSGESLYADAVLPPQGQLEFDSALTPQQLDEIQEMRKRALGIGVGFQAPQLTTAKYTPPLLCTMCHANITWLPKFSPCPYCGYKRCDLDLPSEEPFDETATAADVLRNHRLHTRVSSEANSKKRSACSKDDATSRSTSKTTKACSCNAGRVCTRCRIQQLCDNVVVPKIKTPERGQSQPPPKKTPLTPSQHRKQLLKIFSDMHKMYGGKPTAKEAAKEVERDCEAIIRKAKKGRRRSAVKKGLRDMDQGVPIARKKKTKCMKRMNKRRKSKR